MLNPLFFLCAVFFVNSLALGLSTPVLPSLIEQVSNCSTSEATKIAGYIFLTFAVFQLFCAPMWGTISDRYGRKRILILAIVFTAVDYFLMASATSSLWFYIAKSLSGIFGAVFAIGYAAAGDVSTEETRAKNFGLIGAAFGVGLVFGSGLGGLLGDINVTLPYFLASVLLILVALVGLFFLKETRNTPMLAEQSEKSLRVILENKPILLLLLAALLVQIANQSYATVWPFYARMVMGWTNSEIGYSLSLYGIITIFANGYLVGKASNSIGERATTILGLCLRMLGLVLLSFFLKLEWVILALALVALSSFAFPVLQSTMTSLIKPAYRGQLQGFVSSTFSLSVMIGAPMMAFSFAHFSDDSGVYFPGIVFLISLILTIATLLLYTTALTLRKDR
ncbi:MAG: MFS transporter [Pseudomonadales bacterium]|nr:MFS transporter [Pseudomonadales bacterium]MBO6596608.1 MFS transporter [Pseudomonadales bacterium]MBO6823403.1 MFS transporter [Pseudomonadales bacterium]